jgi:hypothetical protein
MTKNWKLAWVLWGGLAFGLLLVAGCQEGEPGARETLTAEVEMPYPPPDANEADSEVAVETTARAVEPEPAVVEAVPEAEKPEGQADVVAETGPPVELGLRFEVGQTVVYRVTTESQKSIVWEGEASTKPKGFNDGQTGNRFEITFEQRVERVDDGDAIVAITIKALKYVGRVRSQVVLEFDSERDQDQDNPLAGLVGAGYKVEMSAKGAVLAVIDAEQARELVRGDTPAHQTAQKLLTRDVIQKRHALPPLEVLEDPTVRAGQQWSSNKAFSFGKMGGKTFERIYTLHRVETDNGRRVAVVEMKGIPSAALAKQMHRQQAASMLAQMFDNTNSYVGRLELDLGGGHVEHYSEELRSEWVWGDPAAAAGEAEPAALRMGAMRTHRLKRVE